MPVGRATQNNNGIFGCLHSGEYVQGSRRPLTKKRKKEKPPSIPSSIRCLPFSFFHLPVCLLSVRQGSKPAAQRTRAFVANECPTTWTAIKRTVVFADARFFTFHVSRFFIVCTRFYNSADATYMGDVVSTATTPIQMNSMPGSLFPSSLPSFLPRLCVWPGSPVRTRPSYARVPNIPGIGHLYVSASNGPTLIAA